MTNELKAAVDAIQAIGFVGILIILAIPKLRAFVGFSNGSEKKHQCDNRKDIDDLRGEVRAIKENHLHHINESLNEVKTDVAFIKGLLERSK